MSKTLLLVTALLGLGIAGCSGGSDAGVSKTEEEAFRNPPKEIPPESLKAMQKAREEGMRRAEQARQGGK